jgi:hypothetical protein
MLAGLVMHKTLLLGALAALASLPSAAAAATTMPMPAWSVGDFWLSDVTTPGVSGGLTNESIAGTETVTVAGTAHEAWNVTTERESSTQPPQRDASDYDKATLLKLRVVSAWDSPSPTTFTLDAPCPEPRLPFSVGDTWQTSCRFTPSDPSQPPFTVNSTWKALRAESVTVPAGTFDAVVLTQDDGSGYVSTWWWAPAAGNAVKYETRDANGTVVDAGALREYALAVQSNPGGGNVPATATIPAPTATSPSATTTSAASTTGTTPSTTPTKGTPSPELGLVLAAGVGLAVAIGRKRS